MKNRYRLAVLVLMSVVLLTSVTACKRSGVSNVSEVRVKEGPDNLAETNVKLGIGYMQRGLHAQALAKLRKALELSPDLPSAHFALALLHDRLGEIKDAETYYQKAVSSDPLFSEAQNGYGVFLCKQKKFDEAEKHFLLALKNPLYRTQDIVYMNAGVCARRNGNLETAEKYLRKSLQINPRRSAALYQMASLSFEAERYIVARAYLQRYQQHARHTPDSLWLGIRLERKLGDKNAAASYALLLKSEFPDSDETHKLLVLENK